MKRVLGGLLIAATALSQEPAKQLKHDDHEALSFEDVAHLVVSAARARFRPIMSSASKCGPRATPGTTSTSNCPAPGNAALVE